MTGLNNGLNQVRKTIYFTITVISCILNTNPQNDNNFMIYKKRIYFGFAKNMNILHDFKTEH